MKVEIHIRRFESSLTMGEFGYAWRTATSYTEIPDDAAGLADHLRGLGIPSVVAEQAQVSVSCGDWFTGRIEDRPNESPTLTVRW